MMIAGLFKRLLWVVFATISAGAVAFGAIYVQGIPIRAGQETANQLLGANVDACQNVSKVARRSPGQFTGKVVVVNTQNNAVDAAYQDYLPETLKAAKADEVGLILCIKPVETEFDTSAYGANRKYTCVQYTRDLQVFAVNPTTKKVIAYQQIDGRTPPDCPETTSSNLTRYGQPPTPGDLNEWLG